MPAELSMVPCVHCGELVQPDGSLCHRPGIGLVVEPKAGLHWECFCRMLRGGVNHQLGLCTCCGGTLAPDPEGLTIRQAAKVAVAYWYAKEMLFES